MAQVPDRLPPGAARAARSPVAVGVGAGVGALGVVGGLPLGVAAVLAVAAWGAGVGVRLGIKALRRAPERVDPFAVGEPWRRFVQRALQARSRFDEAAARTRAGPLRDRLDDVGARLGRGVEEVWRIARHGHDLSQARRALAPGDVRRQLEALEASPPGEDDHDRDRTAEALRSQLATAERLEATIAEAERRLQLLEARMEEAVARTLELSVAAAEPAALGSIGDDIEAVVTEMEALRQAIEETG